jgi:hypothetical protein
MKQPWEWDEDDLQALITNRVQESIELDYKQCDALAQTDGKKNELSKDVSAFANSAGGTLVYGMIENGHVAERLDGGFDPAVISKEWLDQVINSRIQRRIDGVRIKQVDLARTASGKVAYVVYVPQSMRAPHQAADKKFYKRFNFESVPMEEYEIRDVSRRAEAPDVHVELRWTADVQLVFQQSHPRSEPVPIVAEITNHSATPAEYAVVRLALDKRLAVLEGAGLIQRGEAQGPSVGGKPAPCDLWQLNWRVPDRMPIFLGFSFPLSDRPLSIGVPRGAGTYVLAWEVHAPRMSPRYAWYTLHSDGITLQLRRQPTP